VIPLQHVRTRGSSAAGAPACALRIQLFGKLAVERNGCAIESPQSAKAKELLCYLLLHRDQPHSREVMSSLFWGDRTTLQSKKYFRQTLWQLQQALHAWSADGQVELHADGDSLRLNTNANSCLDTAAFEEAFNAAKGVAGETVGDEQARELRDAVSLYRGDLLEGWYQDWCLFHRERLQNMYLAILEKLISYCEVRQDFESGQAFGELLLRQDEARERSYYRLMHLRFLAGDRAGALRLFQRCEAALQRELGVAPSKRTIELYNRVRADEIEVTPGNAHAEARPAGGLGMARVMPRLLHLRSLLARVQRQIQHDIREVDEALAANSDFPSSGKH
jgi:DNA-binding SARP family transcriptional activator